MLLKDEVILLPPGAQVSQWRPSASDLGRKLAAKASVAHVTKLLLVFSVPPCRKAGRGKRAAMCVSMPIHSKVTSIGAKLLTTTQQPDA